jgi:hypothetical protein
MAYTGTTSTPFPGLNGAITDSSPTNVASPDAAQAPAPSNSSGGFLSSLNPNLSQIGSAAGDLFSSIGDFASGKAYGQAAVLAGEGLNISEEGSRLAQQLQQRQAAMVTGTQGAQLAGAGLALHGTALGIVRSSAEQGSLASAQIGVQGAANALSFYAQQQADYAQESAANSAGIGAEAAGAFNLFSGLGGGGLLGDAASFIGGLF